MTHVITHACCNDAACTAVCPTNCIHPSPDDPAFATAEMLHIDPANCIDCGACVEVCPVDAIQPDHHLADGLQNYLDLNRRYFDEYVYERPGFVESAAPRSVGNLSVAVVGAGPASMYAVEHLLEHVSAEAEIHVYERLPAPWGLVRYGVAPDHQDTKGVTRGFERIADDPRVNVHLNVEVGRDLSPEDLAAHHDAVIYGIGSPDARSLGIPGEELAGSISAADIVAWYNGHPDRAGSDPDLSGHRAVVVGNGNVALDVGRVLASGATGVEQSDISEHALGALRNSRLREVVIMGRRGPEEAAYTAPELMSLLDTPGIQVVLADDVPGLDPPAVGRTGAAKLELLRDLPTAVEVPPDETTTRVVLRFGTSPVEILGKGRVTGVRVVRNASSSASAADETAPLADGLEEIECSVVIRAVGYRGAPMPGLPFDEASGCVPHAAGRVVDAGSPVPGTYVVGWVKRGPSGVIGTNKSCAAETVRSLVDDALDGLLTPAARPAAELVARLENAVDIHAWRRVDHHERDAGRRQGRPRVKVTERDTMLTLGRG
jgi:ferredoxin--NADP+ reductase